MSEMPMKAAIAVALGAGSALACPLAAAAQRSSAPTTVSTQQPGHPMQAHPYLGMWVTGDGRIRQELLPNGRYDEARGTRQSAYQGRYKITGKYIEYWDDTGFTADGRFVSCIMAAWCFIGSRLLKRLSSDCAGATMLGTAFTRASIAILSTPIHARLTTTRYVW